MEKIKVAADSCIIIMLSRLADENISEKDKAVLRCLKNKTLTPDMYEDIPYKYLPDLLQDKLLGAVEVGTDGKKYYSNLLDIYHLWELVYSGKCELYITPTVFGEIDFDWYENQIDFVNKYVNVLQVSKEDECEFYAKRGLLARKYVDRGAMLEEYSAASRKKVPQNDAYIMAEASLFGLILITTNNKDFINYKNKNQDYKRVLIIEDVNKKEGLEFDSNVKGVKIPPQSMTLRSFIAKSRYALRGSIGTKPFYISQPQIGKGNIYSQGK